MERVEGAQYIIRQMRGWPVVAAAGVLALAVTASCSSPLGPKYEYEEQVYLSVDGSATVVIDASLPALVALRGLAIDPQPRTRVDRTGIRQLFEKAGCKDVFVGQPWVRQSRHFVQVRVKTTDIKSLGSCGPLAWSRYTFQKDDAAGTIRYLQQVGAAAAGDLKKVNWDGTELVGFKLHLPSRISYHNVRKLGTGEAGQIERGNILTYEQRLTDRRSGVPIDMEVHMGASSILFQTLWLFAAAAAAAFTVMAVLIWWTVRHGKKRVRA